MPIFEYICQDCGHKFEAIVLGGREAECPKCHTTRLSQQLSVFAVSTKGSSPAMPCASGDSCCMMNGGGCGGGSCDLN